MMYMNDIACALKNRSTPIECLHTILLGPYKYLTRTIMDNLTTEQKSEVQARIHAFPKFGLEFKPSPGITTHSKSFHGKDFKQWAQMCLFILWPYLDSPNRRLWVALSKVLSVHDLFKRDNYCVGVSYGVLHTISS